MDHNLLDAGEIVNTHGIRGEVKITPWADSPEFLLDFSVYYIDGISCRVESARVHKSCVLAKLAGVDTVEDAALFRGKTVQIDRSQAALEDGTVFIADLIGLPVFSGGTEIGKIAEVLTMPANDVYVVKGAREYMIPAVSEFLEEVNPAAGIVRVKLLEGMASDEN